MFICKDIQKHYDGQTTISANHADRLKGIAQTM